MRDLIVLCGPTASGKTVLGAELARRLGGEVVSADAFAVYRGLDIGTAKPAPALRGVVPHHLIDIADPHERYSAGMFLRDADRSIAAITARRRQPVIVGGTHFYVRALLHGLFPEPPKDESLRAELESAWERDPDEGRALLARLDPESSRRIAPGDRQRILRAIEVSTLAGRPMSALWSEHALGRPRYGFVLVGLRPDRDELRARIARRVDAMFASGLVDEVQGLLAQGLSPRLHALKAIGYRECCKALAGTWTVTEARAATEVATRRLAKRQMTWLRGERDVEWLDGMGDEMIDQAVAIVEGRGGTAGSG